MKWLIIIAALFLSYFFVFGAVAPGAERDIKPLNCDTVPTGAAPQLFGSKLYEFRNYVLIDSFIMVMAGDTFAIPRWPALKYKTSDNRWYGYYNGARWRAFLNGTDTISLSNRINAASFPSYANNGLSKDADTIQLGGALKKSTNIAVGTNELDIIAANSTTSTTRFTIDNTNAIMSGRYEDFRNINTIYANQDNLQLISNQPANSRRILIDSTTGIQIGENVSGIYTGIIIQKPTGRIQFNGFPYLTPSTDTTNIKAIGYNTTTGLIEPMAGWPGSGSGSMDTVFSTHVAYVDTLGNDATGVVNNPAKPFATINGALDALPSFGGKIQLGIGEFIVPDTGKIKSNVWFSGSGMPHYDDTITVNAYFSNTSTAITKMIGGTILHGFFSIPYNRMNVDMSDLGVDNGSVWINAHNGGTALDCIGYAQKYGAGLNSADGFHLLQTSAKPRTGIDVWNVSVLVKGSTDLVHGFIFENMVNPNVHDIYNCYGFAGIVIKTMGGIFKGLHAKGNSDAGIYIKSNDYSYCFGVILDGFEIQSVSAFDGGGLHINANDAGSPGIYFCSIANGIIIGTKYGIKSLATGNVVDNFEINNCIAVSCQNNGFEFPVLYYSNISNCTARSCGGDGFNINNGGGGSGPFISNSISASNGSDGFETNGAFRIELENVFTQNNAGYGIKSGSGNLYVGLHSEISNSAGGINGTILTKLTVDNGGTGNLTLAPYAIMAGGTTATGAMQQVSGLGTSGNVLTSNGAGALPTWQAASGVSSINSQTGPAITIQGGTATAVNNTTNTVTVNVTPNSSALPHTLDALFTTQGNSGTGETDLYSYTVLANELAVDGRTVNFDIDGEFNDATATAQLKLYFGGNVTLNTGAVIITTAFTAWKLRGYLIRTSSTTAHITYELQCPGLATPLFIGYMNLTSLDFTTGNIFKITAQAGGAGGGTSDITAHSWQVLYKPQPQ